MRPRFAASLYRNHEHAPDIVAGVLNSFGQFQNGSTDLEHQAGLESAMSPKSLPPAGVFEFYRALGNTHPLVAQLRPEDATRRKLERGAVLWSRNGRKLKKLFSITTGKRSYRKVGNAFRQTGASVSRHINSKKRRRPSLYEYSKGAPLVYDSTGPQHLHVKPLLAGEVAYTRFARRRNRPDPPLGCRPDS